MNNFKVLLVELIINLTPAAYLMIAAFVASVAGYNILPLTLLNVIGTIFSVKLVIAEYTLSDFLYKDSNDRAFKMFTNIIILVIGMTLLSI